MIERWQPWIRDAVDMMDGDGTFRHWKWPGAMADQPAVDMDIYRLVRSEWVRLRNEEMQRRGAKH